MLADGVASSGARTATLPAGEQVGQAIAVRAVSLKSDSQATVRLQLDPPGLGTVRLHLSVSDQTVSARLVVQLESTRQLLESQAGVLRDRLTQAGLTLGDFKVSDDQGGSPGQKQPDQEPVPVALTSIDPLAKATALSAGGRRSQGLVDVIV